MKVKKTKIDSKEKRISFFKFIIQKSQMLDFAIVLGSCLLAYMGIHYCYPYPLTCPDSGGYVDAIVQNVFYVYRPFGYSYFLKILHAITTNIHAIFIVQTFLFFLATSFLALTVKYFYTPTKKWLWYVSLLFLIFTPTSFVMANWIMSDLLFSVLVYFIVSLFIFIIKRESWMAALLYILLLFAVLHVRYSAVIFPFVLMPFFFMKKGRIRWVVTLLSIVVFSVFYLQIKKSMKERVRMEQFSTGFDGWVYANNVFYVLPHIDLKTRDLKSPELKEFHNFIMDDIDIIKDVAEDSHTISTDFMWSTKLQLKQYLTKTMQKKGTQYLPTFVKLGSGVYKDYATHIMKHYPFSYLYYYYFPNFKQAFYPPAVCIASPSSEKPKVIYDYYNIDKENKMQMKHNVCRDPKYNSTMKLLHLMMWISIIGIGTAAFLKRKKLVFSAEDKIVFWGLFCFAAVYYAASIFAAPMEIRYVMSMHSIQFVFCYILLNKLLADNRFLSEEKNEIKTTEKQQKKLVPNKKSFFRSKYAPIIYLAIIVIVILIICIYFYTFKDQSKARDEQWTIAQIKMAHPKMNDYIEACKFFESFPDTIKVVTRKPKIFYEFSGYKKAEAFPWTAVPDTIMSYLKKIGATHVILDDRYRHAYLTLYPAVQKYPEKFKVLKRIGETDSVTKQNPTYVLEFNDEWGYYGERINGQKTGEGYEILQDGRKYVGLFENNRPEGYGTLYDANGNVIHKGTWRNGTFTGAN